MTPRFDPRGVAFLANAKCPSFRYTDAMNRTIQRALLRITSRLCLVQALVLFTFLSACAVPGGGENTRTQADLWPFYTQEYDRKGGTARVRSMGPIYSHTDKENGDSEAAIRPFYTYVDSPSSMEREHTLLYPVGRYRTQWRDYGPEEDRVRKEQIWALPFFWYSYFSAAPGHYDEDWFAPFPLIVSGDSSDDGSHFAFFPFAGNIKGYFGVDEADFALFPLYVQTREGETKNWYFPFPLVRYGSGPDYSALSVLPFYSRSEFTGRYERNSIAWPLVSWGKDGLNTPWPKEYWQVLPFAARQSTAESDLTSILPPFFNFGEWKTSNTTIVDAPWPFFRTAKGDNYEEFRIWPLYSQWRKGKNWNYSALWPIIWQESESDPFGAWDETTFRAWPFWQSRSRAYAPDGQGRVRTQSSAMAWPLVYYRQKVDGSYAWSFPSPLPFLDQRFERTYREIFNVVSMEGDDDNASFEALWGLFRWHDGKYTDERAFHPLIRYHEKKIVNADGSETKQNSSFDFLYGLFGLHSDEGEDKIRLLWFIDIPY